MRGFLQVSGERHLVMLALTPDNKAGLHPALGGAPAGVLRLIGGQVIDIVGELAMQKRLGIFTRGVQQAKVGEGDENGQLAGCL